MKLTSLALAAALAAASAGSSAADLGTLVLSSGSTGFSNTPIANAFSDFFTFMLATPSVLTGSVVSVVSGTQDVDFSSISVSGPSGTFNFTQSVADPFEVWVTSTAGFTLAAGTYTLTLAGTNSPSIGSYGGNIAVTAVPEPQTLAMLLAGLGVFGFMAARRRR